MAIILSDTFSRANADPIGTPYVTMGSHSPLQIVSTAAEGSVLASNCISIDGSNPYSASAQYCKFIMGAFSNGSQMSLILRGTAASDAFIDWRFVQGSAVSQFEWRQNSTTNGTFSSPALNTVAAALDTYTFQVVGQQYTGFQNGVQIFTFNDTLAKLATGTPGFAIQGQVALTNATVTYFEAGNLSVLGGTVDLLAGNLGGNFQ